MRTTGHVSVKALLLCAAWLLACSDDGATPQDLGGDMANDLQQTKEAAPGDSVSDKQAPPMDGPIAAEQGGKDQGGKDQGGKDQSVGACKVWSQWACALPGGKECRATCMLSGTPLQLECSDKGGKADCECKKSGVKTNCSYSGPTPTGCDACKAAFLSGCCNPP